jgi:integration host factor subunit beta
LVLGFQFQCKNVFVQRRSTENFMTRSDLVEELAARFAQLTQRDAEFAVKAILDAMNDALVRGHRIEIRGFGSFTINRRPPRMGRNPRSGESVFIPENACPISSPAKLCAKPWTSAQAL